MFNQAQQDALLKVKQILDEHFEGYVMVYETELDDHSDEWDVSWAGGHTRAVGLLCKATDKLYRRDTPTDTEPS